MFKEFVVILCAVSITLASHIHHGSTVVHSAPTGSPVTISTPESSLDIASPPQHYDIPLEARILQSQQIVNTPSAQSHLVQAPAGSSAGQANVESSGASFSINPAVVTTLTSPASKPEKKVTVETHQHVIAHPPKTVQVISQSLPPPHQHIQTIEPAQHQVQYVSAPIGNVYAAYPTVHVASNTYQETITSTLPPPIVHNVQTVTHRPIVQSIPVPVVHHPVVHIPVPVSLPSLPVPEKKVTIESHQSVTAPPVAIQPVHHHVQIVNRPAVKYVSAQIPNVVHYPLQVTSQSVQSHETITAHPPSATYVTSTVAPVPVHHVQAVVNRPAVQVISTPVRHEKPVIIKPVISAPSEKVTVESHQSVTAHPPTSTVSPIHHVQSPSPVPVSYSAFSAEEAPESQQVSVTKQIEPAPAVVAYPTPIVTPQPIPVPVIYPNSHAFVDYNNKLYTPLIYSKSIVENDHASADLVATHVSPGYAGYSRAVIYSPASQVSRVSFNGLGVSYGW